MAEILGISIKTLKQWLREGRIKGVKVGREWRIMQRDLVNYLENLTPPEISEDKKTKTNKGKADKEK